MPPSPLNTTIRRVYAHSALQSIVEGGGGLFVVGFFVRQGLSYPLALASFAAVLLSRFGLRGAILPLALRIGLRNVLLLGIAVRALSFAMLPWVTGLDATLIGYILLSGLGSVLYWTGYHAFMSAVGSEGALGRQVSVQQAVTAIVGIVAPILGGFLLVSAGPMLAFMAVAALQAAAALPLLGAPNPPVDHTSQPDSALLGFARKLYFAEGVQAGCAVVIWNLALFAALGEHFDSFGGALAVAGIGAAAGSLLIGKMIDGGRGHHSLTLAYGLSAATIAIKALAYAHPWAAIAATALGALVTPMTATAMLSPLYAMAQRSNCVLRFNMATEGGWDLGCAGACLVTAAMLAGGFSFRLPILLGLASVATIAAMLARWYATEQAAA
ncbi:MAG: hypothetical protein RLZZ84_1579 [Pseudomonadota bacterium]|jgi:hypothetical protein